MMAVSDLVVDLRRHFVLVLMWLSFKQFRKRKIKRRKERDGGRAGGERSPPQREREREREGGGDSK